MSLQRVTVLGGSGFVGSHLVASLAGEFSQVQVLTRRQQRFVDLKVLNNVSISETNVHDKSALRDAISGSDIVVNLVGLLNESSGDGPHSFKGAHGELPRTLIEAMLDAGVPRLLHVSALGADPQGSSNYLRTKAAGEQAIREHAGGKIHWTIFRPSVIFGENDAFFNRFAGMLRAMPVFPLACPDSRMAPVYIGDVVRTMVESLHDPETHGQILNLCGPAEYSLREIVDMTNTSSGLNRRIVNLPDFLARVQATVMGWVPGKPFSRDNYDSLQTDSICPDASGRQPTSVEAVMPRYIGSAGHRARQQRSRQWARRDTQPG